MSDLADKSDNAIIRPGLNFQFRLIAPTIGLVEELRRGAQASTFGNGLSESDSTKCCGALFLMSPGGFIPNREFGRLQYFFERDGVEAVVFEFNRWSRHFTARRLDEIKQRTRL